MKRTNKKGFTIVELVIVIAVIAVLAAVLIATFASVIDKAHESSAYADAHALITALLPEIGTAGDTDLIVFSVKGGNIYVYGFTDTQRQILPYKTIPYGPLQEAARAKMRAAGQTQTPLQIQMETILTEMAAANDIKAVTDLEADSWRQPEKLAELMVSCGFDPATCGIRADYDILAGFFGEGGDDPVDPPADDNSGFGWDDQNHKLTYDGEPYTGTVPPETPDLPPQALPGIYFKDGIPYVSCYYDEAKDEYVFEIRWLR